MAPLTRHIQPSSYSHGVPHFYIKASPGPFILGVEESSSSRSVNKMCPSSETFEKGIKFKRKPDILSTKTPASVLILPLHIEEWLKRPEVEYAKCKVVKSKGIHFELELLKWEDTNPQSTIRIEDCIEEWCRWEWFGESGIDKQQTEKGEQVLSIECGSVNEME